MLARGLGLLANDFIALAEQAARTGIGLDLRPDLPALQASRTHWDHVKQSHTTILCRRFGNLCPSGCRRTSSGGVYRRAAGRGIRLSGQTRISADALVVALVAA